MRSYKKQRKSKRQRGKTTYGHGARKKWMGSSGGKGMAGSGKMADQKTTLITKLFGNKYFGKQGETSKGTRRKKLDVINLGDLDKNFERYKDKHNEIDLKTYKVLGDGELTKPLTIKAKAFTASAKEKIEKAGGKAIIVKKQKKVETEVKKIRRIKVAAKKVKKIEMKAKSAVTETKNIEIKAKKIKK